jgi:hypothetical protein
MKSFSKICATLDSLSAEVAIFRRTESYYMESERWICSISLSANETEIKVRAASDSLERAVMFAFDRLEPILNSPVLSSALNRPMLT